MRDLFQRVHALAQCEHRGAIVLEHVAVCRSCGACRGNSLATWSSPALVQAITDELKTLGEPVEARLREELLGLVWELLADAGGEHELQQAVAELRWLAAFQIKASPT